MLKSTNHLKSILSYILGATLVIGGVVFAGTLTPSVSIDTANFVTLSDIYNKIILNTYSTSTHSISTTSAPVASMYTLLEIWNGIPAIDSSKMLDTYSLMGVTGAIAVKTNDNAVTITSTSTNKLLLTVPAGYYGGSATVSTTSTSFDPANIANGVNIFGITGTLGVVWDTAEVGTMDWATAVSTCTGRGSRLPTEGELMKGLSDQFIQSPAIADGFVQEDSYWSSNVFSFNDSYAWQASAGESIMSGTGVKTSLGLVRCVH